VVGLPVVALPVVTLLVVAPPRAAASTS